MSRYIECITDTQGRYEYHETLADENGCKHMINDVCCNKDCGMKYAFPNEEYCETCPCFESETSDDVEALKGGRVYYDD